MAHPGPHNSFVPEQGLEAQFPVQASFPLVTSAVKSVTLLSFLLLQVSLWSIPLLDQGCQEEEQVEEK